MESLSSLAIVFATLIGPIAAVQVQVFLDRRRSAYERRIQIFRTLMCTRGATLSPEHVSALNAIPLEFHGKGKKLKELNDQWKLYLDHHDQRKAPADAWEPRRRDLFTQMMFLMSQLLGFKISKAYIDGDFYNPNIFGHIENDQAAIRQGLAKILRGDGALPVAFGTSPTSSD
mgnify:CR=1 FL=1